MLNFHDFSFECQIQDVNNGYKLRGIKPDGDGFYTLPIGAIGMPTRGDIMYEPKSMINAMKDPDGRFQVCLRDGNLCGEYDHPTIRNKDDMWRLFAIDNTLVSHYFKKIYTIEPIQIEGNECIPIIGVLKPTGPYGPAFKAQLDDKYHNTALSMRTLCMPMEPPVARSKYSWREVHQIITFDAVHAPGYSNSSKRYAPGMESYSYPISQSDLEKMINNIPEYAGVAADDHLRRIITKLILNKQKPISRKSRDDIIIKNQLRELASLRYEMEK